MTTSASLLLPPVQSSSRFELGDFQSPFQRPPVATSHVAYQRPDPSKLRTTASQHSGFNEEEIALAIALSQTTFQEEKMVRDELEVALQLSLRESRTSSHSVQPPLTYSRPPSDHPIEFTHPSVELLDSSQSAVTQPSFPKHPPHDELLDDPSASSPVQDDYDRLRQNMRRSINEELSRPQPGAAPPVSRPPSPDDLLLSFQTLVTENRTCSKCGAVMTQPRSMTRPSRSVSSSPPLAVLHLYCSECKTNHCRGCSTPTACSANCRGGPSCPVPRCCPQARTIGVYEALALFDRDYLAEMQPQRGLTRRDSSGSPRESVASTTACKWEASAVHTFHAIKYFLSLSQETSSDEESLDVMKTIFLMSILPNAIRDLLAKPDIGFWISRSELFSALLGVLRAFVECQFEDLLAEPLDIINASRTSGLSRWMWENGEIVWMENKDTTDGVIPIAQATPLWPTILQLDSRIRQPLLACAAKIQFQPTLDKVHGLCDGILYLILQQLVGAHS